MAMYKTLKPSNSSAVDAEHMDKYSSGMRNQRNYTIGLELDTAESIENLTHFTGGSVGSFCKMWSTKLSRLTPEQLIKLSRTLDDWAEANNREKKASASLTV